MMRRRKGTGTIERVGVRFRARLPDEVRSRLDVRDTYAQAEADLAIALETIEAGAATLPGGRTLRSWGDEVLDEREIGKKRDIKTERSRWRTHIVTADFIDLPMASVSPGQIREWLIALAKKRVKPGCGHKTRRRARVSRSLVQNTLNLLRGIFHAAVDLERIPTNPCEGIRLPKEQGMTHEPWTYLEPHEQIVLFGGDPDELHDLAAYAMGTGVRQGEQWNQRLCDVHDDHVVVRFGSKGRPRKNGRILKIPLFGIALEAVLRQRARLKGRKNPHGLLWPTERGARRGKGEEPREWKAWLLACGIVAKKRHDGRHVRWHDLRHTCGTALVAGWWGRRWSLEEVRQLLGHRSIKTTERYAHLVESALADAARDTSTIRPHGRETETLTIENRSAPPARIGLATFGLGKRSDTEAEREVSSIRGLIVDLSEKAHRALVAMASGGPDAWRVAHDALEQVLDAGLRLNAEAHHGDQKVNRRS